MTENKFRIGGLIIIILALTFVNAACGGVLDSRDNVVRHLNTSGTVSMVEDGEDTGWIVITNGSAKSIYLSFETISEAPDTAYVPFHIACRHDSDKYVDATPDRHSHPAITELKTDKSIRFRIESPVKVDSNCTVGVRYFDNSNAVELLKKVFATPTFSGFSKEEQVVIDRATKEVTLEISTRH